MPLHSRLRCIGAWLLAGALISQNACVAVAPPALTFDARRALHVAAIVPAQYMPKSNFVTFAKSRPTGAAKGAVMMVGTTALATGIVAAGAGAAAPYVLLIGAMATALSVPVGAVVGAVQGVPAEKSREIESVIEAAMAKLDAQGTLARHVATIASSQTSVDVRLVEGRGPATPDDVPAYASLRAEGVDTVFEVAVRDIGFEACDKEISRALTPPACPGISGKPPIRLFMLAQVRVVRVADGAELFRRQFLYAGAHRDVASWAANDARLLADEFARAYGELAERIHDEVLLVAPLDLPAPSSFGRFPGAPDYGICWLAPLYPKVEVVMLSEALTLPVKTHDVCPFGAVHFGAVDSLQPTLRWGAFPREIDRKQLDPAVLNKIGNVTYDLRLWNVEGCERDALVYERLGLAQPEHRLERPLVPAHRYFWSVRARFRFDDRPMATPWSFFSAMTCYPNDISDWSYHRFTTPE